MRRDQDTATAGSAELPDYGTLDEETGLEPQDVDLIRWMLTLSPAERLRYAQRFAAGAGEMRIAGRT